MTNDQLLMAYDQLLTDFEELAHAYRRSVTLADELMPMARRYATPREHAELGMRNIQLTEHRAILVRLCR